MVGLLGAYSIGTLLGRPCMLSPEWWDGAEPTVARPAVEAMYREVAPEWLRQEGEIHAICAPAQDVAAVLEHLRQGRRLATPVPSSSTKGRRASPARASSRRRSWHAPPTGSASKAISAAPWTSRQRTAQLPGSGCSTSPRSSSGAAERSTRDLRERGCQSSTACSRAARVCRPPERGRFPSSLSRRP